MGAIDTSYTFTATDVITSTKMNNILDQSVMTATAITGATLSVTGAGKLFVSAGGITSNELASNAVTSINIADGSVTPAKLSIGHPAWDSSTFTLYQHGFEIGIGIPSDSISLIDFHSSFPIIDYDARIIREPGINNEFRIEQAGTSPIKLQASGGVKFADAVMPNPVGTAPIYGARAWVKLNPQPAGVRTGAYKTGNYSRTATETTVTIVGHGLKTNDKIRLDFTSGTATDGLYTVTSSATANEFVVNHTGSVTSGNVTAQFVAIQGSGNISTASWYDSSDNYIVLNFAIPMPDANYAISGTGHVYPGLWNGYVVENTLAGVQLNTVNQAYISITEPLRLASVVIFG